MNRTEHFKQIPKNLLKSTQNTLPDIITQKIQNDASTRILERVLNTNIFTNITNTFSNTY